MAAVHFTTIPREPFTAHKVPGKPYFCCDICPCANDTVYARFEGFRSFLYVQVINVVKVFLSYELYVNVPVDIFFLTEDYKLDASQFHTGSLRPRPH